MAFLVLIVERDNTNSLLLLLLFKRSFVQEELSLYSRFTIGVVSSGHFYCHGLLQWTSCDDPLSTDVVPTHLKCDDQLPHAKRTG